MRSDQIIEQRSKDGYMNGDASSGGAPDSTHAPIASTSKFVPLYPDSTIDRRDFIKLTLQALRDAGLTQSVEALSKESGIASESSKVADFRKAVLAGNWPEVLEILRVIDPLYSSHQREIECLLAEEKYLELLDSKQSRKALHVLRHEVAPLKSEPEHLHQLSSLMMCADSEDLRHRAGWPGIDRGSRRDLLRQLQALLPPDVMMPDRRLAHLLDQARNYQHYLCPFHISSSVHESLLADHTCEPTLFPDCTSQVLTVHRDQVWALAFSPDGKFLATASADCSALIWRVGTDFRPLHILDGHKAGVFSIAWSPDSSILLTSADTTIKIWNAHTGACTATLSEHSYQISALAWLPDGKTFVSAGMDAKLYFWDTSGKILYTWKTGPYRIGDAAISPDGRRLVAVGRAEVAMFLDPHTESNTNLRSAPLTRSERRLQIYDIQQQKQIASIPQAREMTCVVISDDSRYVIVNQAPSDVYLYDIDTAQLVRRFCGHRQSDDIIRSCFGGQSQNFVISGSEDSKIYIWHRHTGTLINVLSGHSKGSVNAVAWNPADPSMFASAGDDNTVRIWQPASSLSPIAGRPSNPVTNGADAQANTTSPSRGARADNEDRRH